MKPVSKALHTRVPIENTRPAVTPLFQASAFEAGSPHFYTRKSNPNTCEFEDTVRTMEEARYAVAVATGMAAIRICLDQLRPGDEIVMNSYIYGCSYKLIQRLAERMGWTLKVLDLSVPANIDRIGNAVRMVFFETPTNPFLKKVDIQAIVRAVKARSPNCLVVVDNTWATSLFQHPLEHGADVSLHSATKFFSGHSDVMGGILLTDREDLYESFKAERFYSGAILAPHSSWLLRRSLQTLALRMSHHQQVTQQMVEFLSKLPQVDRIYYPDVDGRQLKGYGGIIFFDLREDLVERYPEFISTLKLFGTGTGMACVTSMVAQPFTGSHASMTDEEKTQMGLGKRTVRLCFGLEDVEDLKQDVRSALASIDSRAR
ncbi:PLP-dependent aspartate aminotransferase family protein [Archangium sp.]|uniref:trans-sulfuration enzyme family protein n=1 Tax=Archangium sp. TaxID=1872627 RepID=UPI002D497864|nr:PLP-dependent aspartate aminotransferase family protein [Archangium sp.]HYO54518.1 PLP-dependent aspartate aminotransferase family protein [Archangium sp.]